MRETWLLLAADLQQKMQLSARTWSACTENLNDDFPWVFGPSCPIKPKWAPNCAADVPVRGTRSRAHLVQKHHQHNWEVRRRRRPLPLGLKSGNTLGLLPQAMERRSMPKTLHHWTSVSPRGPSEPRARIKLKFICAPEAHPRGTEGFLRHLGALSGHPQKSIMSNGVLKN